MGRAISFIKNAAGSFQFRRDPGEYTRALSRLECLDPPPIGNVELDDAFRRIGILLVCGVAALLYSCILDGRSFLPEDTTATKHWLDWGSDFYAGISYSKTPDDRVLFQSWFGWPCQINKVLSRTTRFSGTVPMREPFRGT